MTDYQKYINALRKCAKEHENDKTFTGHIIVADLCRDTANLLEELEQDMKEIDEVINCDVDSVTKCKMISNILAAEPHYFKEQFPCPYIGKDKTCEECLGCDFERGLMTHQQQLIEKLSKMLPIVIPIPYIHTTNYTLYDENVTEKWVTAMQNAFTLDKTYIKDCYDALERLAENEE